METTPMRALAERVTWTLDGGRSTQRPLKVFGPTHTSISMSGMDRMTDTSYSMRILPRS